MIVVADVFQGAYEHVIGNLVGDTRIAIIGFVGQVVLKEKPYLLVTGEGLQHAIDLVFCNEQIRDFVLTLSYTFFARLGESSAHVRGLSENLARGVAQGSSASPRSVDYCAVPKDLSSRFTPETEALELIESNKWLVVLLLLPLFIQVLPAA